MEHNTTCTLIKDVALELILSTAGTAGSLLLSMFTTGLLAVAAAVTSQSSAAYTRDLQLFPPVLGLSPAGQVELTDSFVHSSVKQSGQPTCQEQLITHTFGQSYGVPFVGPYQPPSCSFNRVTWNMTVSVAGRQFDRLGTIYLGDIEVWRPTTAEPTRDGIYYTYLKDMTPFLSLLESNQTLTFELDNNVDGTYTGLFNVTLTSQFFTTDIVPDAPADRILGLTGTTASGGPGTFSVPGTNATAALTIPRNVKRAVFTLSATGQSTEEFWWGNVPSSRTATFGSAGTLYGYSPFREIQLYIDGMMAGVAWPYPVIFTGGVVPGLWRPMVGIDALDLKEDEIDISPFLPLLCDGKPHSFTVRVAGLDDDGKGGATIVNEVGDFWLVTGKIFLWLDEEGHVTTGLGPKILASEPQLSVTSQVGTNRNGTVNETLVYTVSARRSYAVSSLLNLAGRKSVAAWKQNLEYSATGNLTNGGNNEVNTQHTSGTALSASGYARRFSYPFYALSTFDGSNNATKISAEINRGKEEQIFESSVLPSGIEGFEAAGLVAKGGSALVTSQNATGTYIAPASGGSISYGTTAQDMALSSSLFGKPVTADTIDFPKTTSGREVFRRHVVAVNGTVTQDQNVILGRDAAVTHAGSERQNLLNLVLSGVPGRGGRWRGVETNPGGPGGA